MPYFGSQTSILADSIAALGKIVDLLKHVTNIQSNTEKQLKSLQTLTLPNHEISRLTPNASDYRNLHQLRNKHEQTQENCIKLVRYDAKHGASYINPRK